MQKLIVIVGATASKKTMIAKKIAKQFNASIINADCFQVYKELNAGINKPSLKDLKDYDFHLINIISIYDQFDIAIYQSLCNQKIVSLASQNKNIILCGGSNLYIDAVIKGYDLLKVPPREAIHYFNNWTYEDIFLYVKEHDPLEANKIGYNNKQRIIRAAQIIHTLKQPKTNIKQEQYIYDCLIIEASINREQLYQMIDNRVDEMMKDNKWVEEVSELYKKDPSIINLKALKALGYHQVLTGVINQTQVDVDLIKQKTRNYAKKQLTWNRQKYTQKIIFNPFEDDYESLYNHIDQFLKK